MHQAKYILLNNANIHACAMFTFWSFFFLIPVLFTRFQGSAYINLGIILWLQLLVSALWYQSTFSGMNLISRNYPVAFIMILAILAIGLPGARSQVYIVGLLFVSTITGILSTQPNNKLISQILASKAAVIFGICIFYLIYYVFISENSIVYSYINNDFPLYRNFRHFNYELAIALPIASYVLLQSKGLHCYFWAIAIVSLCYFSLASAGRGEALSLIVMATALIYFIELDFKRKQERLLIAAIIFGFSLVFITDQHQYLTQRKLIQTFSSESLNLMSAGRIQIWQDLIILFNQQSWSTQLIGSSKNSYFYLQQTGYGQFIQPHNSYIQALLEFGYIGLAAYCYFSFILLKSAFSVLKNNRQLNLISTIAISLIGVWAFSLVDGLFYHGIPLTMSLILISVLIHHSMSLNAKKKDHSSEPAN